MLDFDKDLNKWKTQLGFCVYSQEFDFLQYVGFMLYNMAWAKSNYLSVEHSDERIQVWNEIKHS